MTEVNAEDRKAIFDAFREADTERRRILKIAMAAATAAEDGVLDPIEKAVLGLSGSFEELDKWRELEERAKHALSQPALVVDRSTLVGVVAHKPKVVNFTATHAELVLPLSNTVSFLSGNAHKVGQQDIRLASMTGESEIRRYDWEIHDRPILYDVAYPGESAGSILLLGHVEILASPAVSDFTDELAEVYQLFEFSQPE